MSKGNGVFSNLKKSTKITLISCGCFIALSAAILFFFVMFPITPSEKVITAFGRESIYKNDTTGTSVTTSITTSNNDMVVATTTKAKTTTVRRTTGTDIPRVTQGSGFYTGQKIPSGGTPGENYFTPTFQTTTTSATGGYSGSGTPITSTPNGGAGGVTGGETVTPVEGGGSTGGETVTPVEGGGSTGGEAAAPVEGGGSVGGAAASE
ncbi:MAG: hypothetical protein K5898_15565 [Ruminococcus sp.]|uniref:hypothetical protein n=1 Tax=Ruminococcus sp. TaxID=41978 RepID=UPI0025F64E4A|nr:hypothetical protein [Ruminococcus sp.]MCR4796557.1 hypothetical protein [Ruminococcus sp.]